MQKAVESRGAQARQMIGKVDIGFRAGVFGGVVVIAALGDELGALGH